MESRTSASVACQAPSKAVWQASVQLSPRMLCLQGRPGWQAPGLRGLGRRGVGFDVNLDFGEREMGSRPLGERSWLQKLSAPAAHPS